jgi:hypothetical protein
LEWKARSYLAANCAHCHSANLPSEGSTHSFDFFSPVIKSAAYSLTDPEQMAGYIGKPTLKEQEFPQIVYQGFPESSFVVRRMMSRSFNSQMPPLSSYQIDSAAITIMKNWICSQGTRGVACQLPSDQETDDTFWTTGIKGHGKSVKPDMQTRLAHFQGQSLIVPGDVSGNAVLFDPMGQRIPLMRVGVGNYRLQSPLRSGLYFLKTDQGITKVQSVQ